MLSLFCVKLKAFLSTHVSQRSWYDVYENTCVGGGGLSMTQLRTQRSGVDLLSGIPFKETLTGNSGTIKGLFSKEAASFGQVCLKVNC